jgi:hypothetical protein
LERKKSGRMITMKILTFLMGYLKEILKAKTLILSKWSFLTRKTLTYQINALSICSDWSITLKIGNNLKITKMSICNYTAWKKIIISRLVALKIHIFAVGWGKELHWRIYIIWMVIWGVRRM